MHLSTQAFSTHLLQSCLYFTSLLLYPHFLQVRIFVPDASVPGMNMRDVFPGQPSFASLEGPCTNVFRALDKLKEAHVLSVEIEKQTQKLMVLQQQQQQLQQMALEEVITYIQRWWMFICLCAVCSMMDIFRRLPYLPLLFFCC